MQHPAEYEASLRAERERYVMHGPESAVADVDAELARISRQTAPLEDASATTPLEQAVTRKRPAGRPRKA